MRFSVVILLAIAAVSAGPMQKLRDRRATGSLEQKQQINKTIKMNCEAQQSFYHYCHTCTCAADGKSAVCTNEVCPEGVYNEDGSTKVIPLVTKVCDPGKHFMLDCNDCWCSYEGTAAMCSVDPCENTTCVPGTSTRKDCYECTCREGGSQSMCVAKYCADPFN